MLGCKSQHPPPCGASSASCSVRSPPGLASPADAGNVQLSGEKTFFALVGPQRRLTVGLTFLSVFSHWKVLHESTLYEVSSETVCKTLIVPLGGGSVENSAESPVGVPEVFPLGQCPRPPSDGWELVYGRGLLPGKLPLDLSSRQGVCLRHAGLL